MHDAPLPPDEMCKNVLVMRRVVATLQDRIAALLGLDPAKRTPLVRSMIHRPRGDAAGYWLQLVMATVLATLGLALDSTAVVIGAMLIAPLMRPIVELAMGLATGSTPLVFRTGLRAVASILVTVLASAGIAWLLPFHEITPELLARTAPSILDLFVAAACAMAGAYAVVLASNDVATTAAGTSIGISLVPPLCTAGYGLSIGDWDIAIGAGLLFTANVTGIIVVASGLFVLVGFGQVDIREEERTLDDDVNIGAATRFGRVVSNRGSRLGVAMRVLLPLVLLAAIAVPLLSAVDEMSRRITIRQHVARLMKRTNGDRVVQYSLDQASRPVVLRVVVVGDPASARGLEDKLRAELRALGASKAAVSVWAVSDATAVSALSARLDDVPAIIAPVEPPAPPPPSLEVRVREAWPAAAGGSVVSVWRSDGPPPQVRVTHLGPPIGDAALELLARAVAIDGTVPAIAVRAVEPVELDAAGLEAWLARALVELARADESPEIHYCVHAPPLPPRPRRRAVDATDALARTVLEHRAAIHANVHLVPGDRWRVVPTMTACEPPPASPSSPPPP